MSLTVARALQAGAGRLEGIADNPRLEARLLLGHALGFTQNQLISEPGRLIDPGNYEGLLARREAREPLALILGHREFWSLDFQVSRATLIPRADSETLIEAALAAFAGREAPRRILDLGTGTGCLLLALLYECQNSFGVGIDLQPEAVALAGSNAARLGLSGRSAFVAGNWTDAIRGKFDLIVSNPPYIRAGDIPALMPEVASYEPRLALDGGVDGYDAYRELLARLPYHLGHEGVAVLEMGQGQADMVCQLARDAGLTASLRLDLAKIPRAVALAWPNC